MKLFMILLGCKPKGRCTEQHDIYFGIGNSLKELLPGIIEFWPEAKDKIHIDAWREVTNVNGYTLEIAFKNNEQNIIKDQPKLFFINLGGYKQNDFDEYHYKMLVVTENKSAAINQAKETAFYKHTGFAGASSHIDDKYGIDVDDVYEIDEILPESFKKIYAINIFKSGKNIEDEMHLGYLMLEKIYW